MKPEETELFRNTHTFQDLGVVANHFTHGGNNFQSCTVAGINSLHQEINMRHTLSASVNQVVRYWLLPLLTETIEHEDQMTATMLA